MGSLHPRPAQEYVKGTLPTVGAQRWVQIPRRRVPCDKFPPQAGPTVDVPLSALPKLNSLMEYTKHIP